jgi:hypothetical protein
MLYLLRFLTCAVLGLDALVLLSFAPAGSTGTWAQAATVSVEFRTALDPYGRWRRHDRWGDVWVPARVDRDWRPYTVGHWVYSDDYGWYWVADGREARWGWVVYHYGRWMLDPELGWVWVPGNEWAPAWVSWRRGHRHIGWAPLPPQRLLVTYRDQPDVWIFVRANDFTAPRIATVALRPEPVYVRETVLVNRTVALSGGAGFAVNPGIAPTVVSAVVGQPLRTYEVRPRVLAGTASVPNAVTVRASELKQQDVQSAEVSVKATKTTIQAAKDVPEPKALADNENGRLGDNPPKAAKQTAEQKQGQESGDKSAAQKPAEEPKGKSAAQKPGEESKGRSAQQKPGEESKSKSAQQKQGRDEPAAKASAEQKKPEPSGATSAKQNPRGEPAREAAGQNPRQRPDAAAQKQAPSHPRQARQPAAPKNPETAGQAPKPAAKSAPAPGQQPAKGKPKGKPDH